MRGVTVRGKDSGCGDSDDGRGGDDGARWAPGGVGFWSWWVRAVGRAWTRVIGSSLLLCSSG